MCTRASGASPFLVTTRDRFSLVKKKNDKKREGPTRMQPLHTATRALFCHERKQTGNKLKIYACTRAQFPVRQMDRPTVRLTANRPSVKPIVSLLDVTMFPIFFTRGRQNTPVH